MEAGLRIPDDISIIGIGCEEDANPHLSTINVDVFKMAELAGETVINLLEHRNVPEKQIYFDTRLIERGSCKSLQN
jgi:LacI family transcriptional regulator